MYYRQFSADIKKKIEKTLLETSFERLRSDVLIVPRNTTIQAKGIGELGMCGSTNGRWRFLSGVEDELLRRLHECCA